MSEKNTTPETPAKRKQISVSLSEREYAQFTELAFTLRRRKDSDVLRAAIEVLGGQTGIRVLDD